MVEKPVTLIDFFENHFGCLFGHDIFNLVVDLDDSQAVDLTLLLHEHSLALSPPPRESGLPRACIGITNEIILDFIHRRVTIEWWATKLVNQLLYYHSLVVPLFLGGRDPNMIRRTLGDPRGLSFSLARFVSGLLKWEKLIRAGVVFFPLLDLEVIKEIVSEVFKEAADWDVHSKCQPSDMTGAIAFGQLGQSTRG